MSRGRSPILISVILGTAYFIAMALPLFEPDASVPIDQLSSPVVYVDYPDAGQRLGPSESELMILDLETRQSWQLTNDAAQDFSPGWSPEGSHVLFISSRSRHSILPWPIDTGATGLFTYDLKAGAIERVDLSWLRDHRQVGTIPAMDQREGWLDCASWAPSDSTVIYLGLTVGPMDTVGLTPQHDRRLVRVDMESRNVDVLSATRRCGNLRISPNGRYISGAEPHNATNSKRVPIFDLEAGGWKHVGVRQAVEEPAPQYPLNWLADGRLALYASGNRSVDHVYAFDPETGEGTFIDTLHLEDFEYPRALVSAPSNEKPGSRNHESAEQHVATTGQIIIDKRVGGSGQDDLFLHDIATGKRVRLTSTMYPKDHVLPRTYPVCCG